MNAEPTPRPRAAVLIAAVLTGLAAAVLAAAPAHATPAPQHQVVSGRSELTPPTPPPTPPSEDPFEQPSLFSRLVGPWIESLFAGFVDQALNPLLGMLGDSLLATPRLDEFPQVRAIWETSRSVMLAVYATVIVAAGIVVMAHQTVQTRYSVKEILPRVAFGFIAANMSLLLTGKAIDFANALSGAVLGEGLNGKSAAATLRTALTEDSDGGGLLLVVVAIAVIVMIVLVLLTYVVRLMVTVILLAGAPLFLLCHALPQTESIAVWWWKAMAGVLVIQTGQALTLIAAMRLFFAPGGLSLFG